MQTRTLYALIAASLVLASGAALAQETTDSAAPPAEPATAAPAAEPAPVAPASPAEPAPATRFAMHLRPGALWLMPGSSARLHVVIEGAPYETYTLHLRLMDGLEPVIGDARAMADENGRAEATLALSATDTPTKRVYVERVLGTSEDGLAQGESLRVHVKARDRPAEPTKPEPVRGEPAKPVPVYGEPAKRIPVSVRPHPDGFVVVDPAEAFGLTKPLDHPERVERVDRTDRTDRADLLRIFAILERLEARLARYEASCVVPLPMASPATPEPQGSTAVAAETTG